MKRILNLLFPFLLLGCQAAAGSNLSVRYILESESSSASKIQVFLEGSDGNSVTGSTVVVCSNGGVVNLLNYDYDEGCYQGDLPVESTGTYLLY